MPCHNNQFPAQLRRVPRLDSGRQGFLRLAFTGCVTGVLALGASTTQPPSAAPGIQFNRDIRPILSENCFQCHGPDKNQRKAKLRLDVRESAIDQGAIVPGRPGESPLIERVFSQDPDEVMPPPETHKTLGEAQKKTLERWIASGAEYQPHWSYITPARPAVPATRDPAWVRNPIDAFILAALEARNLRPSREADARTLQRRLSLDLIGLPPEPAGVGSPNGAAYERYVEQLLASRHFGERMAVGWLDGVRFADTVGYHGDQNMNIFPYRDYVIDAFNRNKPFDRFTLEQIAGDLLPNPTAEQRVATGFNRLNMMTREGGAQPGEYLVKYAADRVRTVSTAWLGSTMGCAECHDHKYDPFSAKDFYSLAAFFADIRQWGVYNDYTYTPNPDLKGWSNDHPFPPELTVESPYLQKRLARLSLELSGFQATRRAEIDVDRSRKSRFEDWQRDSLVFLKQWPEGWAVPAPDVRPSASETNENPALNHLIHPDQSILFTNESVETVQVHLSVPASALSAIRLELLPDELLNGRIARNGKSGVFVQLSARLKPETGSGERKLAFHHAEADLKDSRYSNGYEILGVQDGWKASRGHLTAPQTAIWWLDQPAVIGASEQLWVTLKSGDMGRVRLAVSPFATHDPTAPLPAAALRAALEKRPSRRTGDERALIDEVYLFSGGLSPEALDHARRLQRDILECRRGRSPTLITVATNPLVTRVLPRGNWQDESGEIVQPAVPHFLPQPSTPDGRPLTRLDLARWLVSPENPLTARTFVNRLWKQFFGAGLSAVVDDLGAQGEWPSNADLLDWLAVEFQESGWDVKHIVRLIVMSSTYRQDSNLRPDLKDIDPNNRLLASQSPRRLEAEFVRDNALSVAGLLNLEIGGPSAFPYQPAGYYAPLQFPDREYQPSPDERQYRRGVYTHWQRAFLHPMLANFDAPSREECTAFRTPSNTPQQALTLLNDPTFVEAARALAANLLASQPARGDEARLNGLFERVLNRAIRPEERTSLSAFLTTQRRHYGNQPDEAAKLATAGLAAPSEKIAPAELAAWTSVCRVILNLHETLTRY